MPPASFRWLAPSVLAVALAGCATTLAPHYERPETPIAAQWPTQPVPGDSQARSDLPWQWLFAAPELQQMVQLALDNNRDLRVTSLNVERALAQYRIQRSQLRPDIGVGVAGDSGRTPASISATGVSMVSRVYSAELGIASWELDLFGRLRSLRDQALQDFLATNAAHRAVELGLIAGVANAYFNLAADHEQLALARSTLQGRQEAYDLQRQLLEIGNSSELALRQAEAELESARDRMLEL
ncbi:outer membrane protein TolC [Xanthomonas campestris]|uniref:TolC family protein n=1 Tax=Xanthomonas sp. CFBP 8151 TaxID=3035310 RepID=UPI0031B8AEE0|nr:outer membrane protein TolC [Xanthomonas sp. CFBP 8151]